MDTTRHDALLDIAESIFKYARRWVVSQSPSPVDAVIYDAAVQDIVNHGPHLRDRFGGITPLDNAAAERRIRNGDERITEGFSIPVSLTDSVVRLHRFARRYTNGRGTYTAAVVNQAARDLLALGASLSETRNLDGTIWAADGHDGDYDGLDPEQRAEALSVLPRHDPA